MKWGNYIGAIIIIVFCFTVLFCGAVSVFSQDAGQQLNTGQSLATAIISSLKVLEQQIMQSGNESENLSDKLPQLEQQLERSENLAKQLGNLVDDQQTMYKVSLRKWKLSFFGLIGLLVVYNLLKAYLRTKGIRLW